MGNVWWVSEKTAPKDEQTKEWEGLRYRRKERGKNVEEKRKKKEKRKFLLMY